MESCLSLPKIIASLDLSSCEAQENVDINKKWQNWHSFHVWSLGEHWCPSAFLSRGAGQSCRAGEGSQSFIPSLIQLLTGENLVTWAWGRTPLEIYHHLLWSSQKPRLILCHPSWARVPETAPTQDPLTMGCTRGHEAPASTQLPPQLLCGAPVPWAHLVWFKDVCCC